MFIFDFPNYEVFEDGSVFSHKNQVYLKPQNNGNGYLKVHLYKNGKMHQHYVHKLVAITFIPNPNNFKYVDHIDRDKTNNSITNLRWCSASANTNNTANRKRYSISKEGAEHYSKNIIIKMQNDFLNGLKVMEISRKYDVPRQSVSRFIKNIDNTK